MLFEPTTLAATATALAQVLTTYGCDPRAVFAHAGLDFDSMHKPGARYPFSSMQRLWAVARAETGDPCIGLIAGRELKPQALHALGLSWMASRTLDDGFSRMARYSRIANTSLRLSVVREGRQVKLEPTVNVPETKLVPESVDSTLAVIVNLCRFIKGPHYAPVSVEFVHDSADHAAEYIEYFRAPVHFGRAGNAIHFDAASASEPIPAGNEELAAEIDRIAERYLATLETDRVQDKVREILLTLLPSGEARQELVARSLNRSVSALQRQLKAEGASYRQVLDETRQQMALRLVREREYSLGQIAYLLGFSDQANFSRAFKRWTGQAPTSFR